MARITQYPEEVSPSANDVLLIDGDNGSRKVKVSSILGNVIAPVEQTSTSSKNYAIRDQFIFNGLLTEATATISQGSTITVGESGNAKLADSVAKQLTDLNNDLNYTTAETEIGTWIDGRTLYRRVIQFTMNGTETITLVGGTTGTNTPISASWLSDVREIVRQYGTAWANSSKTSGKVPVPCTYNNNQQINIWINVDNQIIYLRNIGYQNCQGELVLEYTKK